MLSHQKSYKCLNTSVVVTDQGFIKVLGFFFGTCVIVNKREKGVGKGRVGRLNQLVIGQKLETPKGNRHVKYKPR